MSDVCCRKSLATGSLAGAGGQFLASPGDLVKIRLQMEGRRILDGHKPRLVGIGLKNGVRISHTHTCTHTHTHTHAQIQRSNRCIQKCCSIRRVPWSVERMGTQLSESWNRMHRRQVEWQ